MSNIPGATNALPGTFTDVVTQSSGIAIPGGSRVVAMIGQGSISETVVAQAQGKGLDGLNSSFTSATGASGRYFALQNFPLVSNRNTLYKNGVPLVALESLIDNNTFSYHYDYRIDINTGHIQLQAAHLVDQGGTFYSPLNTNVGLGSINSLQLLNVNAPPEIWTVRCVSVQRDVTNSPVAGTAKFLAFGSVSGPQLDTNGNPIVWKADGYVVNNSILSFSITETKVLNIVTSSFREGDGFTILVASGVLVRNDSLTTNEIPVNNINLPTQTQGMRDVINFCGTPSLSNNLSLGAQLCYANGASSMIALQSAPPLPRRTSYVLDTNVPALSTNQDDFIFPFPIGVVPDVNADIHVFVTSPTTQVEKQLLPNKFPYYTLDTSGQPTTSQFVFDNLAAPSGNSFAYTVKQSYETLVSGYDGYMGRLPGFLSQAVFGSSIIFDSTYAGKLLKVIDSNNKANIGTFNITAVTNGQLSIQTVTVAEPGDLVPFGSPSGFPDFVNETPVTFQLINIATGLPLITTLGSDGILVKTGANTATGTCRSVAINFALVGSSNFIASTYKLQISGSTLGNNGLYDITSYNSGTNTLSISMGFVIESNLSYEVLDPTLTSNYLVLNHNVVPNGNQLRVTIVDHRDATFYDPGWINALAALETVECDILVTLPNQTISVIFQNALTHCLKMSNIVNKKERVLFLGAISGLTPANLTGVAPAAVENIGILEGIQGSSVTDVLSGNIEDLSNYSVPNSFGQTYRSVYFYPDQIVVQAGLNNVLIDGFYIAAAAAGYESADVRLENPLTNKVLSGFTILRNKMFSTLVLQQLAAAGVTTLQPVAGGGKIVWGLTTAQSGFPEEQEISIVFIRDRVAKVLRAGFQGYIGTPETLDTAAVLNTNAIILLNSLVSQRLITAYKDLAVVQDSVDPRQWDISVRVQPTYPVNFIYIKVSLGQLASG